jgi:hypothetical protein
MASAALVLLSSAPSQRLTSSDLNRADHIQITELGPIHVSLSVRAAGAQD